MSALRLFPIVLEGSGTAEVESLPSYIHRIAWEHGVFVGELLRFLYAVAQREQSVALPIECPRYPTVNELVRPNAASQLFAALLQHYAGQPVEGGILWLLQGDLGWSQGEIAEGFRWCPECVAEMISLGKPVYFKLLWHLAAITACPLHRTPLLDCCDLCQSPQTTYRKRCSLGCCQACGERLARRKQRLRASDIRASWEDIGLDLVQLFVDALPSHGLRFPRGGIKRSVDDLFNYYWTTGREAEMYACLSRDQVLAIVHEQTPVSLKSARRIAFRLGLSLFDLLAGNASQTTDQLDAGLFCQLPPGYLEVCARRRRDHRAVLRKIKRSLGSGAHPPSLKELARHVEVSVGYLQYRYPVLAKDVVARHAAYIAQQKRQRLQYAQKMALDFFVQEKYAQYPHSRKQAYRVLREETGLPKFLLKRSIQSAYQALH